MKARTKWLAMGVFYAMIAVLTLWLSLKRPEQSQLALEGSEQTSQPDESSKVAPKPVEPAPQSAQDHRWAEYNRKRAADPQFEWKTPIEFYGKVVDEHDVPVVEARVRFIWNDLTAKGSSDAFRTSDNNGLFSITGVRGKGMNVEVEMKGYHVSRQRNQTSYEYAGFWESNYHVPDPAKPVVFHLQKIRPSVPLVFWSAVDVILPADGRPVHLDLLSDKREAVKAVGGDLQLVFHRQSNAVPNHAYDWTIQISGTGGAEVVETTDEFMVEAPEKGYQAQIVFSGEAKSKDWREQGKIRFFVRNLTRKLYAAIIMEIDAGYRLRDPSREGAVFIKTFINPNDSRNLEDERQR